MNQENQTCCGNDTQCENTAQADRPQIIVKPAFSTSKTQTGVKIIIDLPGVSKDKINIKSEETRLSIKAEKTELAQPDWQLISDSDIATDYELNLELTADLDLSTTAAKLEKGVLTLGINKHEKSLPREITISDE